VNPLATLRTLALAPPRLAYALWTALAFLGVGLTALLLLAVLPDVARRRAAARAAARTFLRLAAMPLTVRFPEHIPPGQCVVVCNHASYLDGIVLTAALPPRFGFVIKREMAAVPLAGAVLRRLGSEFVERFNRQRGAADARRVLRNASNGHSLVFFPEGTFTRTPGLLKFHTGAFATAARAGELSSRSAIAPMVRCPCPPHAQAPGAHDQAIARNPVSTLLFLIAVMVSASIHAARGGIQHPQSSCRLARLGAHRDELLRKPPP